MAWAAAGPNAGFGCATYAVASLIVGVIGNILNPMNVQSCSQQIATGVLIIGAVTRDRLFSRK